MDLISHVNCFSWHVSDWLNFLFLFAALIMLTGENMQFRPAISIWFVFVHLFLKFNENDNIQKLKASSFRLWKKYFCGLNIWHVRALQSSITFLYIHHVVQRNSFLASKYFREFFRGGVRLFSQSIVILATIHIWLIFQHVSAPPSLAKMTRAWCTCNSYLQPPVHFKFNSTGMGFS